MDNQHLLVINSGSSSIKFSIYELDQHLTVHYHGLVENIHSAPKLKLFDRQHQLIKEELFAKERDYHFFFELLLAKLNEPGIKLNVVAAGHRVVHGGKEFYDPTFVSNDLVEQLKKFIPFAPLHQPYNLKAIEVITQLAPELKQIACFDTAFHRSHPLLADSFALPQSLSEEGVKRYGFHGLSYEFIMHQLHEMKLPAKRIIIAHLGNGASMCAVKEGRSIDSTMGFTALDGLMMGTRCGSLDPGVLLYLLEFKKLNYKELENLLYKQSGLLGVSGLSSNVKELLEADAPAAQFALNLFVYRIRKELGALTAVLGGLDCLVFTGGIGEHAAPIREAVCIDNEWLGIHFDAKANNTKQMLISAADSKVAVYAIPTDEEWMIAHHCSQLLNKDK